MKPTDARSAYRLQWILWNLADHDHTRAELAAVMHVTRPQSLAGYLDYLVGKRLVHILRWTEPAPVGTAHPQTLGDLVKLSSAELDVIRKSIAP